MREWGGDGDNCCGDGDKLLGAGGDKGELLSLCHSPLLM